MSVMRLRRFFLYGTLQPGADTRMGRWIAARAQGIEAASVPGAIHAVKGGNGWFPALVPARGQRRVRGHVCNLRLKPCELALLDRYEGIEYRRMAVRVSTDEGGLLAAQAYLWRIALPAGSRPIPSGDYLDWLSREGLAAFTTLRNGA